jgi:DNA-binding transcriptional regulator YiaG
MPLGKQETQGRACPTCGHRPLELQHIRDEFDSGPDDNRVHIIADNVPVMACSQCGEKLRGPEAARVRHLAICRTLGLLTPEQIQKLRERLTKTPAEFARLTGIDAVTLDKLEHGRLLPSRSQDRYLRLLQIFPSAVGVLEQLEDRNGNGARENGTFPTVTEPPAHTEKENAKA